MTKTEELQLECYKRGLKYVGTRGNVGGPIAIVGEAPGADEDQAGAPFVGAAGRELDRMLCESQIDLSKCWWTNPYKVRPPENKLLRLPERGIPLKLYEDQFFEELACAKPTFILCLGATALRILCPQTVNPRTQSAQITKYQGSLLRSPLVQWPHYVIPALHPAALFRDWSERQMTVLCLAKAGEEYAHYAHHSRLRELPNRRLVAEPAADDAIDYLTKLCSLPAQAPIAADIENIGTYRGPDQTARKQRLPYVIAFSHDPNFAMSIGFAEFDTDKSVQIWRLIDRCLRTKVQVWQNGFSHDIPWLQYIGFAADTTRCHDTLVRHWVLWPELSHKLETQTIQYTREPYYKDEGKNWSPKEGKAKLKRYNCLDAAVTLEIFQEQEKEFQCR
jgi:uracil-DNA glycosylase family 4